MFHSFSCINLCFPFCVKNSILWAAWSRCIPCIPRSHTYGIVRLPGAWCILIMSVRSLHKKPAEKRMHTRSTCATCKSARRWLPRYGSCSWVWSSMAQSMIILAFATSYDYWKKRSVWKLWSARRTPALYARNAMVTVTYAHEVHGRRCRYIVYMYM